MVRCETCSFWRASGGHYDDGMGLCQAVRERWEIQNAPFESPAKARSDYDDWEEVERLEKQALGNALACVVDGSGYHAALLTRSSFGCVLHQPKEPHHDRMA